MGNNLKENLMIMMENYYLMENIYMDLLEKEKNILKVYWNMKENIYLEKNGMEKDMIKREI